MSMLRAAITAAASGLLGVARVAAAEPDWEQVASKTASLLSEYIRIDTANPPGNTTEAAAFLQRLLEQSGLSVRLHRRRSGQADRDRPPAAAAAGGAPIVLLNHMDVVPGRSRALVVPAVLRRDPRRRRLRARRARHEGPGDRPAHWRCSCSSPTAERPQHDILFLAVPDEEVGGTHGHGVAGAAAARTCSTPRRCGTRAASASPMSCPRPRCSSRSPRSRCCGCASSPRVRPVTARVRLPDAAPRRLVAGAESHHRESAGAAIDADRARGLPPRRRRTSAASKASRCAA